MKKEELRKIIDRFPTNTTCNIDGSSKYICSYILSFNGYHYDVYSPGDYGEIYYYAKNVDEDTACATLLSHYKEELAKMIEAYYKYQKVSFCGDNIIFSDCKRLKLQHESEYLNVNDIEQTFLIDGDVSVKFIDSGIQQQLYHVKIFRDKNLIWDGRDALFRMWFNGSPIISSKYNNVILMKDVRGVGAQPVILDLSNGREFYPAEKTVHGYCNGGLLYSLNVAVYSSYETYEPYMCYDIEAGGHIPYITQTMKAFPYVYKWSVCPVPDCILLLTLETKNNLILYNVRKCEVVRVGTFPVEKDKKYDFGMWFDKEKKRVIIKSFCPTEPLGKDVQCYSVYFDGHVSN